MIASPAVRCVVFDLGGVLVRIARSWTEACSAAGLPVRGDADVPARVLARRPWVHAYEVGQIPHGEFLRQVAAACGHVYAVEEVARIHAAWLLEEYPRIGEVLDAVEAWGATTAILSNTNAAHWEAMLPSRDGASRFPTLRRVRHPCASHLLGARKPEPAAWAHVERVEAARAHGWQAELVDPRGDTAARMLAEVGRRLPATR
jgi:FMN phosphatase YigB (HAD superfamily)